MDLYCNLHHDSDHQRPTNAIYVLISLITTLGLIELLAFAWSWLNNFIAV